MSSSVPSSPGGHNDQSLFASERNSLDSIESDSYTEATALLSNSAGQGRTALPKLQIFAVLFIFLPESVTSTLIYPFVVQVRKASGRRHQVLISIINNVLKLVRDLNIVKGDPAAVGYFSGLIVRVNRIYSIFFTLR